MIYALIYGYGDEVEEIYLYSTEEKAKDALIQRMTDAVRDGGDLDFSNWEIVSWSLDEEKNLLDY